MLDPRYLFQSTSASVKLYSAMKRIPESILVGIINTNRMRDLTPSNSIITSYGKEDIRLSDSGGAKNFLAFLSDELIPIIDKKYATNGNRTFFGHSNGGLFAAYILIEMPDLFDRYIIGDPTVYWDNELVINKFKETNSISYNHIKGIHLSSANNIGDPFLSEKVMLDTQRKFVKAIRAKNIRVQFDRFDDENHTTVPFVSFRHGLDFVFK